MAASSVNKQKVTEQILSLIATAENALQLKYDPYISENFDIFEKNMVRVDASFSGSWLGYHANVYYVGFATPAAGDSFSTEWGLMNVYGTRSTDGWQEVSYDQVKAAIMNGVDTGYESSLILISDSAREAFEDAYGGVVTLLAVLLESKSTQMLEDLQKGVSDIRITDSQEFTSYLNPKGSTISRDSKAVSQGAKIPPHAALEAWLLSKYSPFNALSNLIKESNKLLKYMKMNDLIEHNPKLVGKKVFIGHGRSLVWRELKDFLDDRLKLDWDEFNRQPTAGLATKERLQSMLDQSCFAFLIMTGEDQHAGNKLHARENVVHEVGLFQGRLGFQKAIVLLEEGCEEFTNITGIGQIRFPKDKISACFEEIRCVLEREGIL